MSLDMKHKNIGATVSMLTMIHKLSDSDELPVEITNLFMLESKECDFQMVIDNSPICVFNGSTAPNLNCCIGECPLGRIIDEELKLTDMSDIESKVSGILGADPEEYHDENGHTMGGHVHMGPPMWWAPCLWFKYHAKRHLRAFRGALMRYWEDRHYWLKWILLILGVDILSKLAGTLSVHIW